MSSQLLDAMMEEAGLTRAEEDAVTTGDTASPHYWSGHRKMDEVHWSLGRRNDE